MTKLLIQDGKNSYSEQVGPGNTSSVKQYTISGREITKNGYVYIYVSNETPNVNACSPWRMYWDNLHSLSRHSGITHVRGALLQEEGYYPFGLEMKALCSQAATVTTNNYKFNGGTELENSIDVSYYETYFRNYDAQVGRFIGVDALAEQSYTLSPYQFAINNPIQFNDPWGLKYQDPSNVDFWNNIINTLWSFENGGTWTATGNGGGTYYEFPTTFDGFIAGASYMDNYNLWGQNGFANSWEDAAHTYAQTYHETPLRPIIIQAHNEWGANGNYQGVIPNNWADVYEQLSKNGFDVFHNVTPFEVGECWLSGKGPKNWYFYGGDYFTELLRQHGHIADTRALVINNIQNGGQLTGYNNYNLGGLQGVPKYFNDYSTLLTAGNTGNLAVTYLGSYSLQYNVLSITGNSALVQFIVTNSSTISSATHPPVIGYTPLWNNTIGSALDNIFSSGPMSKTTQTFNWTETLTW